ncbi:undecaprenyl-diphosphate phosphatase [Sphingomonas sp. BN140010]|uniref:Undecaprenyl-diphosphatase n=1 Tax=Sphingomonas arvum TaxID=2992113 RepID=A0ABT3JBL2_9SPHN|nr:undecaprenyl-diphosphate phosphatase [Sphingomonas sp. BN140010]MCW3796411.1 undecaprenyl-diphosphate phosphatase [Sphingomonas sp. BN140010]
MPIWLLVVLLGVVEGLTEYLPVSSTGHLILATELLGFKASDWEAFNVAIQPGAILAIVVLYWRTFRDVFIGLFRRDAGAWRFVRNLIVACLPAIILALLIGDYIESLLSNALVVAWALVVGGLAIFIVERLVRPRECGGVQNLTLRQSLTVGAIQCLAMIPGVSRSGATILGAMSIGVDRKTAAEFSFFLAMPTLSGATAYFLLKHHDRIAPGMYGNIALGAFVSFIVALVVVKVFVATISRFGFTPFAWYRIIAGGAALAWLAAR